MNQDKQLLGAAGEHLVLSRLLTLGYLAAPAPRGTRKADVLVNPLDNKRPWLIQVKTTLHTEGRAKWHMKEKHEEISDEDMFYEFITHIESRPLSSLLVSVQELKIFS